ncbi:MAG: ATP-binding protein [Pseudomonadota bacterium]|nr:ATP-binding protein [Pseudomonadota bacterium]
MNLGKQLLLLSGTGLLALSWIGYHYLSDVGKFLIEGQERTQLLAAQAVASSLQNRDDLFEAQFEAENTTGISTLFAYPIDYLIKIDGYRLDWEKLAINSTHYASKNIIRSALNYDPTAFSFRMALGQRQDYLYALIQITDSSPFYRNPAYRRLDNSDHVQIVTLNPQGEMQRFILTTQEPGPLTAYQVGPDWKYPVSGKPVTEILGFWRQSQKGYNIEFRLPLSLIGDRKRFSVAVADVVDGTKREVQTLIGTVPTTWSTQLNQIELRSPELTRIIEGLKRPGADILIVDQFSRVRAHVADKMYSTATARNRNEETIRKALKDGIAGKQRFRPDDDVDTEVIMAVAPIRSETGILGAVIVELATDEILSLQKETLENSATQTALVVTVVLAGLLIFSSRLTYRIKRLENEISELIDNVGRLQPLQEISYLRSHDEIGRLSRAISSTLVKLKRRTNFLEHIPRILKHEINNPLNTISTSVQNLAMCQPTERQETYMDSARRGINRLYGITNSIADAANLEEALKNEEFSTVNLSELVRMYVASCQHAHPNRNFEFICADPEIHMQGNSIRIEQLLDKLVDNAVEFSPLNSTIQLSLESTGQTICLAVANSGPPISAKIQERLTEKEYHLQQAISADHGTQRGLGLFVVLTIAEHLGGKVSIDNKDNQGVRVSIYLPLHSRQQV